MTAQNANRPAPLGSQAYTRCRALLQDKMSIENDVPPERGYADTPRPKLAPGGLVGHQHADLRRRFRIAGQVIAVGRAIAGRKLILVFDHR